MLELRSSLRDYNKALTHAIDSIDCVLLEDVIELLRENIVCESIFIIGNGGNASTASHIACDLQKGLWQNIETSWSNVSSLSDNIALFTAWANDYDFESVYSRQLEQIATEGDILIALSASGNSHNIVHAVGQAILMNIDTIGISGFNSTPLSRKVKYPIIIESEDMQIIEDATLIIGHFIFKELSRRIAQ
jgi:D-sedoheptulose 7-phosphate isomerase